MNTVTGGQHQKGIVRVSLKVITNYANERESLMREENPPRHELG